MNIKADLNCPFCEILKRDPSRIIESRERFFVILSDPRLMPGHLLIIPRRHVQVPWEMPLGDHMIIVQAIMKYQKIIIDKIAEGCDVRQNYRPFIKDNPLAIKHLHWHLIPRDNKDKLYQESMRHEDKVFAPPSSMELKQMMDIYRGVKPL